jgi:peptidyl-prolyl cis-trans isomerase D
MAPEFRKLTVITVRPEDLIGQIAVSDEAVKKSFEDRRSEFTKPELRQIEQMLFTEQKAADKAALNLKEGKAFLAVAKNLAKQSAKDVSLGNLSKAKFLVSEARDKVFALKKGHVSAPIKTAFGWAIFRVTNITPGKKAKLADLKKRLAKDLKMNLAGDEIVKLSRKIQDGLGAGDKPEVIARTYNLKIANIAAIDKKGRGRDGKALKPALRIPEALVHAFKIKQGADVTLEENQEGNYFMVRVNKIIKPAPRPIKDVTKDIEKSILADARKKAAVKLAQDLAKKIAGGEKLASQELKTGWSFKKLKAFNRLQMSSQPAIGTGLRDKIFKASKDSVVQGENRGLNGVSVARVLEIEAANDAKGKALKKRLASALRQSIAGDLGQQFRQALEQEHKTEVNQSVLQSVLSTDRR